MEKYYTPEIEEFHVGFEYETKRKDENSWIKRTWNKYDVYSSLDNTHEEVRVKYLDREDVESLGFEDLGNHSYEYGDSKLFLSHYPSTNELDVYVYKRISDNERDFYFQGTIKNKSELKKLLKQLGI